MKVDTGYNNHCDCCLPSTCSPPPPPPSKESTSSEPDELQNILNETFQIYTKVELVNDLFSIQQLSNLGAPNVCFFGSSLFLRLASSLLGPLLSFLYALQLPIYSILFYSSIKTQLRCHLLQKPFQNRAILSMTTCVLITSIHLWNLLWMFHCHTSLVQTLSFS